MRKENFSGVESGKEERTSKTKKDKGPRPSDTVGLDINDPVFKKKEPMASEPVKSGIDLGNFEAGKKKPAPTNGSGQKHNLDFKESLESFRKEQIQSLEHELFNQYLALPEGIDWDKYVNYPDEIKRRIDELAKELVKLGVPYAEQGRIKISAKEAAGEEKIKKEKADKERYKEIKEKLSGLVRLNLEAQDREEAVSPEIHREMDALTQELFSYYIRQGKGKDEAQRLASFELNSIKEFVRPRKKAA